MKKRYVIVKYISEYNELDIKKVHISKAVHPYTYTADKAGVTEKYFMDIEKAKTALNKMVELNPSVDYGIIEVESWWENFIYNMKLKLEDLHKICKSLWKIIWIPSPKVLVSTKRPCLRCFGYGQDSKFFGNSIVKTPCSACGGEGSLKNHKVY